MMVPTCIDLFAGCGGLSLGLRNAGFRTIFAVEGHRDAFSTYAHNLLSSESHQSAWPEWLERKAWLAEELLKQHKAELQSLCGTIDLIAGGPPCQGFSMNGQRRPDDPRSQMVEVYLQYVAAIEPKLVLIENVVGFQSMRHPSGLTYSQYTVNELKACGYDVWSSVLRSADWGVPQRRPRFVLIAARAGGLAGVDPFERLRVARKQFLERRGLQTSHTGTKAALSDLIADEMASLPDPEFGLQGFQALHRATIAESPFQALMREGCDTQPTDMRLARHRPESVARMRDILQNCERGVCLRESERERLGIRKRSTTALDPEAPAPTIGTLPDDYVHYEQPRSMTVREHARLQSFPDWFEFKGPYTTGGPKRKTECPRFTQVGNAVPPLLAEALGETLIRLLTMMPSYQLNKLFHVGEVA